MRKMYEIQFRMTKTADKSEPDTRLISVGLEGINIVDAIIALEGVLPEGTEVDIYSAKLEQIVSINDKGSMSGVAPEEAEFEVIDFAEKKKELGND